MNIIQPLKMWLTERVQYSVVVRFVVGSVIALLTVHLLTALCDVNWLGVRYHYSKSSRFEPRQPIRPDNEGHVRWTGSGTGLAKVYETLTRDPDVRSLSAIYATGGCVIDSAPFAFDFQDGDRFPALEKLKLYRYDFKNFDEYERDQRRWRGAVLYKVLEYISKVLPLLEPDDWPPLPEPNIDKWLRAMDFGRLRKLELGWPQPIFLDRLTGKLPSLESFALYSGLRGDRKEAIDFINSIDNLQELKIFNTQLCGCKERFIDPWSPVTEVLSRKGPQLQSLSLHHWESSNTSIRRPTLSVSDIERVYSTCPHLVHFGFDIDRNESWPFEILEAVAAGINVTHLTIGIEFGVETEDTDEEGFNIYPGDHRYRVQFRQPELTEPSARELFIYLQQKKIGAKLNQVDFIAGDLEKDLFFHAGFGLRFVPKEITCIVTNGSNQTNSSEISCINKVYDTLNEDESEEGTLEDEPWDFDAMELEL